MKFANGESYLGQFKDGWRSGSGVQTFQDKSQYQGMWEKGRMSGTGVMTDAKGRSLAKKWWHDNQECVYWN